MSDIKGASGGFARKGAKKDPLGPNTEIARKLKQYYTALVQDEVPDRFAQLLSKLESVEPRQDEG